MMGNHVATSRYEPSQDTGVFEDQGAAFRRSTAKVAREQWEGAARLRRRARLRLEAAARLLLCGSLSLLTSCIFSSPDVHHPYPADSGTPPGVVTTCTLPESAACEPGAAAPSCCVDARLCADNGLGTGSACCRSEGGACSSKGGCCGNLICAAGVCSVPLRRIEHVVLIVQENHSFDSYFGQYCSGQTCTDRACSALSCTSGPSCCERAPRIEPGGAEPYLLNDSTANDASNFAHDRNHSTTCELAQLDYERATGLARMDHFVTGSGVSVGITERACSTRLNWVLADQATAGFYWNLAASGALADRYFQPIVGSTSSNDMYFAVAGFQFIDNALAPNAIGANCVLPLSPAPLAQPSNNTTIADLLIAHGNTFSVYADGYRDAVNAATAGGGCPSAPSDPDCISYLGLRYHCLYDPSDVPFEYYRRLTDNPLYMKDHADFATDIAARRLPDFSFVKARTFRNEHPGWSTVQAGVRFVTRTIAAIQSSPYANNTLILITWDEGGGFFDHVPPPMPSTTGEIYPAGTAYAGEVVPYGTRVPLLAVGTFARHNAISHVQMEHSSIVRFLEWNFLGPDRVGALGARDGRVNNIGSLLDPATGVPVER